MKVCTKCHQAKPESEFPKHQGGKGGLHSSCQSCLTEYMKHYYNTMVRGRFHRIKSRARKKGIPFNILAEEFTTWFEGQQLVCHYCGEELTHCFKQHHKITDETFDRKDNNKGYTIDNLVLACRRCNMIKGEWFTEEQMLEIAQRYFGG